MSRLTTGISGAVALVLVSGAAQFALGGDLGMSPAAGEPSAIDQPSLSSGAPAEAAVVNCSAKTDRTTGPAGAPALTRTVSLKLSAFSDTTFLLRVAVPSDSPTAASSPAKPAARKLAVACEPVVSMLTEVAKQLQPGSCVT